MVINESECASLRALLRAGTTEQRLGMRTRIVLAAAEGTTNKRIAGQLDEHRRDRHAFMLEAQRKSRTFIG